MALGFLYGAGGGGASIPDGATVLPVGDVYTLQRCAGIKEPQYTTLAELLADATTLAHVINSANAINYLVRSKTWINNEAKVPSMTSNTMPIGQCIGDSEYSSAYAFWMAFDGVEDYNNPWSSASTAFPHYIGYVFSQDIVISSVAFSAYGTDNARVKNFKIQGYDGQAWNDLYTGVAENVTTKQYFAFDNNASYQAYRLYIVDSYNTSNAICSIVSLQFYGPSITLSQTAMSLIGANNYASDTLLADSDWCEAIVNSPYFESVLSIVVPTMTSDTTPSGVASASQEYNNSFFAYYAFDRDLGTRWMAYPATNQWVGYMFPDSKIVCKAVVTTKNAWGATIKNFKIQGSNTSFTSDLYDLCTGVCQNTDDVGQVFNFSSSGNYKYYRLLASDSYSSYIGCIDLKFYGREDV